ncbi:hypothetical protein [Thiospirillum jenense]|uniref:Uncharacterized protein n=1 Tax=Thiospirillum jenense TaxID=1653858 RepID=A0A839HIX3_9GAMM|nr:hypothetical protein [Thiospirillum jenense]MBB1126818.1 hypothetical protein [Thiospirillum jenense]
MIRLLLLRLKCADGQRYDGGDIGVITSKNNASSMGREMRRVSLLTAMPGEWRCGDEFLTHERLPHSIQ